MSIGDGRVEVERARQDELRLRSLEAARRSVTPLEMAVIVALAFAVPAMAAWSLAGIALAVLLGAAMWLFERGRRRSLQREGLVQLWRTIEDACCLDDVREAAREAVAELDALPSPHVPQR